MVHIDIIQFCKPFLLENVTFSKLPLPSLNLSAILRYDHLQDLLSYSIIYAHFNGPVFYSGESQKKEEEDDLGLDEMAEEVERFARNMNTTRGELRKAGQVGELDLEMGAK